MTAHTLSIVIPAFNEATRLASTIAAVQIFFAGRAVDVVVADDGSTDDTRSIAEQLDSDQLRVTVVSLDRNRGKGAALRAGVAASTGDRVLVMDADLATDLEAADRLFARIDDGADIAIGSRSVPGSNVVGSSRLRALMGRTFNRLVRSMLGLSVLDSQCGFKAFRGDDARLLFSMTMIDGYAIDPEVLEIASILGMGVEEVPVRWTAIGDSKVRPVRDSIASFRDLVRIGRLTKPTTIRDRALALGWKPA